MPAPLDDVMAFVARAARAEASAEDDARHVERARRHVAGNARLTPEAQVDIYRRQFWLRHVDSLRDDYPGLVHVLGDDAFEAFARGYLVAHPPTHVSLRDLGHAILAFADSYAAFPGDLAGACRDMLRYEHALIDLFDAAEPAPLDPQKLAAVPDDAWDRARVVTTPNLALLDLDHAVQRVRVALKAGESPGAPAAERTRLALYRFDDMIRFDELGQAAFELLSRLARGEPLARACEAIAEGLETAAREAFMADVGPWFSGWAARRLFVDVVVEATS